MKNKKNLSKKDLHDWKEYLNNPKDLIDKDSQSNSTNTNKGRFTFDLHGHSLIEANKKVDEIVKFCTQKKYSEILLITGKGIHSKSDNVYESKDLSKLRHSVPEYLNTNDEIKKFILKISTALDSDGGDGAILIKLKKL